MRNNWHRAWQQEHDRANRLEAALDRARRGTMTVAERLACVGGAGPMLWLYEGWKSGRFAAEKVPVTIVRQDGTEETVTAPRGAAVVVVGRRAASGAVEREVYAGGEDGRFHYAGTQAAVNGSGPEPPDPR